MFDADSGEGERFYMRILLNHMTRCSLKQVTPTVADGTVY